MTTPTLPEALRALADVLEFSPGLPGPDLSICATPEQLNAWRDTLGVLAEGAIRNDYASVYRTGEHRDELYIPSLRLRVFTVHEQSMRVYYAGLEVQKRHADEIGQILAEQVTA